MDCKSFKEVREAVSKLKKKMTPERISMPSLSKSRISQSLF